MTEIGFYEEGRYLRHPEAQFFVEFPPGPLAIGEEPIKQIVERKLPTGTLKIISLTDCVKDRLAAYYHWSDQQSLLQAVLVSQRHKVNINEIRRWSLAEGKLKEFEKIKIKKIRKKKRKVGKITRKDSPPPPAFIKQKNRKKSHKTCLPVYLSTC